jgi:adenylyltransferase/sulfurtransferase
VPLVYGSIFQFEGQVSVFHRPGAGGSPGYSYRDLFHDEPPPGLSQNCGEAGVIGVLPGVIGTLQAAEAIKIITGLGEVLSGQLLTFDALTASTRKLALARRAPAAAPRAQDAPTVSIGGEHMPLATLPARLSDIPGDRDVVVYCQSGMRSSRAALYLRSVKPGVTVLSLKGGVDACLGARLACT